MSEWITQVRSVGEEQFLASNMKIPLNSPSEVLFLEEGSINLFAIEKEKTQAAGPRHFIGAFKGPALLFGFEEALSSHYAIVAITETRCALWKAPLQLLSPTLTRDPSAVHHWMTQLDKSLPLPESSEQWQQDLEHLHHTFLTSFTLRMQQEAQQEQLRAAKRQEHETHLLHGAFADMVSILDVSFDVKVNPIPFFQAYQIIGAHLETACAVPEKVASTEDPRQLLSEISRSSEIPFRQVSLTGAWWTLDGGALLGFFADNQAPIALLPTSRGGRYRLIEPTTLNEKIVDASIAKQIHPTAFSFSPPFPESLNSTKGLLFFFLKHSRKEFFPLILYSLLAALIAIFPPVAMAHLFNTYVPDAQIALVWQVLIAWILAGCAIALFFFLRALTLVRIEGRSSNQIQLALFDRLLKLSPKFFRNEGAGDLLTRILSIEHIRTLITGSAARALFSGIFSLLYIIVMFLFSPLLTLVACCVLAISLCVSLRLSFLYARKQTLLFDLYGKGNAFVVQILASIAKLRTAGAENYAFSRWASEFATYKKLELEAVQIQNSVNMLNTLLPFALYLGIFTCMILGQQTLHLGTFLAFNAAFVSFYLAFIDLNNTLLEMAPIFPLCKRVQTILAQPPEERIKDIRPGRLSGKIEIRELSFRYDPEGHFILNKLTFEVQPGQFIGIVGPSGCGKSTLLRLLLGFETPHSGAVYYDDQDLSGVSINEVRRQLGVVLQEEGIIGGSIYDNLCCGRIYSQEQVTRALTISGFATDLENFPMGVNTHLPTGGGTLSGGQKQRLLIARALLPNPKILLLDEATSALDNTNQEQITQSLNALNVTRVVIAHRLSTLARADKIYVMDKGSFIQEGTFDKLATVPGLFSKMLKRQQL